MFVNNIICTCFPPKERERDREKELHHLYPTCWQALGKLPYNREKLSNVHCQNKENIYSYIENTVIIWGKNWLHKSVVMWAYKIFQFESLFKAQKRCRFFALQKLQLVNSDNLVKFLWWHLYLDLKIQCRAVQVFCPIFTVHCQGVRTQDHQFILAGRSEPLKIL